MPSISIQGAFAPPVVSSADLPRPVTIFPNSELSNADRLVYYFGDRIRYCYPWKNWLIWTGTHWAPDRDGEIHRMAERVTRSILLEAAMQSEPDLVKASTNWYFKSSEARKIRAFIELAQPKCAIVPENLDTRLFHLPVQNGTLDLRTGELEGHRPEDYFTRCLPIAFDPDADCPQWKAFLLSIMGGNAELVTYLQRAVGYSLTGDVREQVMFILHGNGANGKSTFIDTLAHLLGDYAQQTPTDTLMAKRDKGIPNDIARMRGARFVAAVESEQGRFLSEALVKQLTGSDLISARFLNQEFFDFKPSHKIFLATNHLPRIKGTDRAIWRRLPRIPFTQTFWNPDKDETGPPELRMDKTLCAKLRDELPGILTWALTGCLMWQNEGLTWPAPIKAATDAYQAGEDLIGAFLAEHTTAEAQSSALLKNLYTAYLAWAEENGDRPLGKRDFSKHLVERGLESYKGHGNKTFIRGLQLTDPNSLDL